MKTGIEELDIRKLGFGLMRLPEADGRIDLKSTIEMVDCFMQNGFTYFDTAYVYYDGESERIAKKAVTERYPRESFLLATKLPGWEISSKAGMKELFETSLERTGAGYFDVYLLHSVMRENRSRYDDAGAWEFVRELKEKGLVRFWGFSYHDSAEFLDELLIRHPEVDLVQLQINYADWNNSIIQSRACYETARRHNKPVIIMEPLKGGLLADVPQNIKDGLSKANPQMSMPEWALRFGISLDGVINVLSGMSSLGQMKENVNAMKNERPLTAGEFEAAVKAGNAINESAAIPCTSCRYCVEVCPQGIKIPDLFVNMNNYLIYKNLENTKGHYGWLISGGGSARAGACAECGSCEQRCPQHIRIIDTLKEVSKIFDG